MIDSRGGNEHAAGLKVCRRVLHPIFTLAAAACLLSLIGWTGGITSWQHWLTTVTGLAFGFERGWVYQAAQPRGREKRRLLSHLPLAVAVFILSFVLLLRPFSAFGPWSLSAHVFIQAAVIISGVASMIHHQKRITARAFHPGMVLIFSFMILVAVGALLLKMPRCTVSGLSCSWLEAVFTSTSAVCVTGLTLQNTPVFFSITGQVIILLLIQVGGLGIMTLTFFAAVVLFEGLSLHDRLLLGKLIQENRLARVGQTLAFIVSMTIVCELTGAVILFFSLDPIADPGTRIFHSVFHSISAFCNAGFSTLPDNLMQANQTWQICIMFLIVIGGIGSIVAEDLTLWTMAKIKRRRGMGIANPRLRVHTRLVLIVTSILIIGGAAVIMITEFVLWKGPQNGGTVLTAFFHSVTARTAGFNTVPMTQIGPLTIQTLMLLMLIGGSPGGTAGGIRTVVLAVGLGHLWNQLRQGRRGMIVFNRTISRETGSQALGLMVLAVLWLIGNFLLLEVLQAGSGISGTSLLFELISAFATVGLSLDLTPHLTDGAKALMIVNMFVGRIGLLTVLATLIPPDHRPLSGKPAEDILLT